MRKRTYLLIALSVFMVFVLSGCFSQHYQVRHNPDESGSFSVETIFMEEFIFAFDETQTLEEARKDILSESVLNADDVPQDDPNILSVTEDDYFDDETGSLHHVIEIEFLDILTPIQFDETDDFSRPFTIQDYGDGTYLFSAVIESLSEFIEEDEGVTMDQDEAMLVMEGSTVSWQLNVEEFIEGDERAVYDPVSGMVSWEIPMFEALFGPEPVQIFAIYRLEARTDVDPTPEHETPFAPPIESPEPTGGLFSLPRWAPALLITVLCLGMLFAVVVVGVIILVVRRRK